MPAKRSVNIAVNQCQRGPLEDSPANEISCRVIVSVVTVDEYGETGTISQVKYADSIKSEEISKMTVNSEPLILTCRFP